MKIPTFARRLLLLLAGLSGVMIVEGRSASIEEGIKNIFKRPPAQPVVPSDSSLHASGGGMPRGGGFDPAAAAIVTVIDVASDILSEPGLRKRLDGMGAKKAMEELETALETNNQSLPAKFLENLLSQGGRKLNRNELKRQVIDGLKAKAEAAAGESMPSESFELLCKEMSEKLAAALKAKLLPKYKRVGPMYVLAGGNFTYKANTISEDFRLPDLLKEVMLDLNEVDAISENFRIVSYDVPDAEKLLDKISGGRENLLREDGRNHMDLAVRDYHPADIFIITGRLHEIVDQFGCRRTYWVRASVEYPIKRHPVTTVDAKLVHLYHPTRGWLTEAEDAAIGASAP